MSDDGTFISYAQHGEDVILWRALGDRTGVFYVDVGAFDPTFDSVTRALYERGWRGINIEAQPDRAKAFDAERPEDTNLGIAVGDHDGVAQLVLREQPGWATTLDPAVIHSDPANSRIIEVPMRRLDSLLAELGVAHVDVLKIDVEGAEPAVVRGLLGGPVRPLVCVLEGVAPGIGRTAGEEGVELLVQAGYRHCLFDGLNHYLTIDPDLEAALSTPANPLDGHVVAAIVNLEDERTTLHATIAALATENLALRASGAAALSLREGRNAPEPDEVAAGRGAGPDALTGPLGDAISSSVDERPTSDLSGEARTPLEAAREPDAEDDADGQSDLPSLAPEATEAPEAETSVVPVDPIKLPARRVLDHVLRAERRRSTFIARLRGRSLEQTSALDASPSLGLFDLFTHDHTADDTVKHLYRHVLGREADPEGLATWAEHLDGGMSALTVAREFAKSPEFMLRSAEHRATTESQLRLWGHLRAAQELGLASLEFGELSDPPTVAHRILVRAVFEVALARQPTAQEEAHEVGKLTGAVSREWMIRAFALRPDVRVRLLGSPAGSLVGRWRYWRDRRQHVGWFRDRVVLAEARQIDRLAASVSVAGRAVVDAVLRSQDPTEER